MASDVNVNMCYALDALELTQIILASYTYVERFAFGFPP